MRHYVLTYYVNICAHLKLRARCNSLSRHHHHHRHLSFGVLLGEKRNIPARDNARLGGMRGARSRASSLRDISRVARDEGWIIRPGGLAAERIPRRRAARAVLFTALRKLIR